MCIICENKQNNEQRIITCVNVFEIPFLPRLEFLDCSRSINIREIPFLPSLVELRCNRTKVKTIPLLPELQYLNCTNCPLETLPLFPKLLTLISDYSNIKELPKCDTLTEIMCNSTNIEDIPSFPELRGLYCVKSKVKTISENLPELRRLNCAGTRIEKISKYKNLVDLVCSDTPIGIIPNIPTLQRILCMNCPFLVRIETNTLIYNDRCKWIQQKEHLLKGLKKSQKIVRFYLYRRRFNTRLVLNHKINLDLINQVMTYL